MHEGRLAEIGPGRGVVGVDLHRLLQQLDGGAHGVRVALAYPGAGVGDHGVDLARGGDVLGLDPLVGRDAAADAPLHLAGHPVLEGEDVVQRTAQAVVPDLDPIGGAHQADVDQHPLAGPLDAAVQQVGGARLRAIAGRVDVLARQGLDGGAAQDPQVGIARQGAASVVPDGVHQVGVGGGEVVERQHRQGLGLGRPGGMQRPPCRGAAGQQRHDAGDQPQDARLGQQGGQPRPPDRGRRGWGGRRMGHVVEPLTRDDGARRIDDLADARIVPGARPVGEVDALALAEEQRRLARLEEHLQQPPVVARQPRLGLDVVAGHRRRRPAHDDGPGLVQRPLDGGFPGRRGRDVPIPPDVQPRPPQGGHQRGGRLRILALIGQEHVGHDAHSRAPNQPRLAPPCGHGPAGRAGP